ncbi:MAG: hypothetical protein ACXWC5_28735, partial [Burkholderiales bacterium]
MPHVARSPLRPFESFLHVILFLAAGLLSLPAHSADAYPSRPVRMLVPYPPGGGLDLPGRAVGEKFAQSTGRQLILDNRGGAGGL